MKTRSHKQKVRKTKRQKKVRSLQIENEELRTKLSQYEVEIAAQAEQFRRYKEEYQQKIDRLKAKIRLQRKEDIPILEKQIINWMFFGVIASILPLAMNVSYIWVIGLSVKLADVLADFVLVLFAISMNLLSILSNAKKSFIITLCICISMLFAEFSISVSSMLMSTDLHLIMSVSVDKISIIFLLAAISILFEVILGVFIIVLQNRTSPE